MGTWGVGLFSDDTASDVRGDYRDRIGDGMASAAATDEVLAEWAEVLADPEDGPVVWLALAATQVRCGRLEDRVRDRAIAIIDRGDDVRRWADEPRLARRRAAVLAKLRAELLGPQRAPTRIRRPVRSVWPFEAGSILGFRRLDGRHLLFRVRATSGKDGTGGGRYGVVELLDWSGDEIPGARAIAAFPVRQPRDWTADQPNPIGVLVLNQNQLDRWWPIEERVTPESWTMHTLVDTDALEELVRRRYEL